MSRILEEAKHGRKKKKRVEQKEKKSGTHLTSWVLSNTKRGEKNHKIFVR